MLFPPSPSLVVKLSIPEEEILEAELASCQSAAIIKVGRHFEKVRRVLRKSGLAGQSKIVEAATNQHQKITALDDVPQGERPYFSTILVYRGDEPW